MAYNYMNASASITYDNAKDVFISDFQNLLNLEFSNASDVYTIQEETTYASGVYRNVVVRINSAITAETGIKLGDDYKKILFSDVSHATQLGYLYQFDNNYWITVFTESIKNLASSIIVKRCNNTLRWLDASTGAIYSIPVSIAYDIRENRNYATAGSAIVLPSGFVDVIAQFNTTSNKIKPNQRFLVGNADNWTAYRVVGNGINNFNLTKTNDNMSCGLIDFTMENVQFNEDTDDLVNGIADARQNVYTITLNDHTVTGSAGGTVQLSAVTKLNGLTVTRPLTWTSSNTAKATVNSSGLVTFVANGAATITCQLTSNTSVYDACAVTVSVAPPVDYKIVVTPSTPNYLLQGQTQDYTIYLYGNGSPQLDTFTFTVHSGGGVVPTDRYTLTTLHGNSFRVKNMSMYLDAPLVVRCTPNLHGEWVTDVTLWLRGAW